MTTASAIRTTFGRGRLFDSILDTVGDTPTVRINRLGVGHAAIYVKAEFFNPAGSVKDRLALNIIEAAERSGALKPGQTVVEATSGNTGIGLAMVRSEEHTSELQSLMRISYAVFCLKNKTHTKLK